MAATPPMTPPAMAPTLAPDPDEVGTAIVEGAEDAGAHTIFWQALHVGGTKEQTSSFVQSVGQGGVSVLHLMQARRKREAVYLSVSAQGGCVSTPTCFHVG